MPLSCQHFQELGDPRRSKSMGLPDRGGKAPTCAPKAARVQQLLVVNRSSVRPSPLRQSTCPACPSPRICNPHIPSNGAPCRPRAPRPVEADLIITRGPIRARPHPISPDLMHARFPGALLRTAPRPHPHAPGRSTLSKKFISQRRMAPFAPATQGTRQCPHRRDTVHAWSGIRHTTGTPATPGAQASRRWPATPA